MKRKVQKRPSKKNGLREIASAIFLSSSDRNKSEWNDKRYRMILDCGYEEKEENSAAPLLVHKPGSDVIRDEKHLQLFAKCAKDTKSNFFLDKSWIGMIFF